MVKIVAIILGVIALAVGCLIYIVVLDDLMYWATDDGRSDDRDHKR